MTDFLKSSVENEKIVRNSIRNDARSVKDKFWYYVFLEKIDNLIKWSN